MTHPRPARPRLSHSWAHWRWNSRQACSRHGPHRPPGDATSIPCPQSRHSLYPLSSLMAATSLRHGEPSTVLLASPFLGHPPDLSAPLPAGAGAVKAAPAGGRSKMLSPRPESGAEPRSGGGSGPAKGSLVALTAPAQAATHPRTGPGDGPHAVQPHPGRPPKEHRC